MKSVAIKELKVPELVELTSNRDILLDCDFDYEESEKQQLDIKWYFNDDPTPFFFWVPFRMAKPQLIGETFKGHVDLDHTVHADRFKRHRAILIKRPTIELSGTYTCKVSTFEDEDVRKKPMIIYCKICPILTWSFVELTFELYFQHRRLRSFFNRRVSLRATRLTSAAPRPGFILSLRSSSLKGRSK